VEEQHPGKWPAGPGRQQAERECCAVTVMKANRVLSCLGEGGGYSP